MMRKKKNNSIEFSTQFDEALRQKGLTRQQIVEMERELAKFANTMDSIVRIPFTKQGIGADAALSTIPIAGDIAGLLLTGYAFWLGIKMGVPINKLTPALRLAFIDMIVGIVPGAGTLMDIFIRPSRRTLEIVRDHIQEEYGVTETSHLDRPFMHQSLQNKQQDSKFWRNPVIAWIYLHIPDIFGVVALALIGLLVWTLGDWVLELFNQYGPFKK